MGNKERIKENLENLALPAINFVFGVGKGVFDIYTTGYPLVSGGSELFRFGSYLDSREKENPFGNLSFGEYLSYTGSSLLGSAIPFGIKYFNEIYNFVEGILK